MLTFLQVIRRRNEVVDRFPLVQDIHRALDAYASFSLAFCAYLLEFAYCNTFA